MDEFDLFSQFGQPTLPRQLGISNSSNQRLRTLPAHTSCGPFKTLSVHRLASNQATTSKATRDHSSLSSRSRHAICRWQISTRT